MVREGSGKGGITENNGGGPFKDRRTIEEEGRRMVNM